MCVFVGHRTASRHTTLFRFRDLSHVEYSDPDVHGRESVFQSRNPNSTLNIQFSFYKRVTKSEGQTKLSKERVRCKKSFKPNQ